MNEPRFDCDDVPEGYWERLESWYAALMPLEDEADIEQDPEPLL